MAKRRGRGIDFEHRFNTSRWAEDLLFNAINQVDGLLCFRLGLSQTAEDNRPDTGDEKFKEPDLVVFRASDLTVRETGLLKGKDLTQLRVSDIVQDDDLKSLLRKASCAIEVEFSPYQAAEMKGRHWKRKSPALLAGKVRKTAIPPTAPNVWVKLEDLGRLKTWESEFGVNIVVAHVFDQEAFSVSLSEIHEFERNAKMHGADQKILQLTSGIFKFSQSYDRVDAQGARETKTVFVVTPDAATKVGDVKDVIVGAQCGLSGSKKYVAHVIFSGGSIDLSKSFIDRISNGRADHFSKKQ